MNPDYLKTAKTLTLTFALATLGACGGKPEPRVACTYQSDNLLEDTVFNTLGEPRRTRKWTASGHARSSAFESTSADGVLTIRQVASEPWYLLTQVVDHSGLAGKKVEYSAELKLDTRESLSTHKFKFGAGLTLRARAPGKASVKSSLDHEPHSGTHDWFEARIVVQLPQKTDFLQAGFLHQAGGILQARNPSLRVVGAECPITASDEG